MKLDWLETTERADGEGSGLSLDSAHLSRVRNGPPDDADSPSIEGQAVPIEDQASDLDGSLLAGDCTTRLPHVVPGQVAALVEASIAESTRRAYRTDLAHFAAWGGQLPAEPAQVASFLAAHAETLSVATLVRRIATISKAHEARGLPNPCRSEIVRATMRGVKRTRGVAQREAKPLLREDLFRALDAMGEGVKDARDRAMLLIGFAGGFRRSEIVALNCDDVERVRQGLILTLRRSKTDQEGAGRKVGIPFGRTRHCPVLALDRWLAVSGIEAGPVFRPVDRHSRVASERLSGQAVSLVVKERVAAANIDPAGFSGHSLRAGFATSAVQAGVSTPKVRQQTGHASDAMLARYVRDGELFVDNAAGALL
jgi:integrase